MRGERDNHIKLRARPHLRLRAMQDQRIAILQKLWRRFLIKALRKSWAVQLGGRARARALTSLSGHSGSVTKALSRCRLSSRARQVPRIAQLARMHLRKAAREGLLTNVSLGPGSA